jgi:peptidoglycan/LPS O-acetylase OafA/YrhL
MRPILPALTGLRFVAAMCVLINHSIGSLIPFPNGSPIWHFVLSELAVIGMPLFFVLSGFVMHYNYSEDIKAEPGAGFYKFLVARFARLYPLYIFCVAFDLVFKWGYGQLPAATPEALPYYLTLTQSWFYIHFGDASLIRVFGLMPTVSWSISTEFFFYLCFPLVCLFTAKLKSPRSIINAIAILSIFGFAAVGALGRFWFAIDTVGAAWFGPQANTQPEDLFWWFVAISPYVRIMEFAVGCLCAALFMALSRIPVSEREQRLGAFLTWAAIILISAVYCFFLLPIYQGYAGMLMRGVRICFGLAPFIGLLIFCCARYRNVIVLFLSTPLIVLCGEASYSLYMLHEMLIDAFKYTVGPVLGRGIEFANGLMWLLMISSSIGLSLVSWRLIEVPARRWLRSALSPTEPVHGTVKFSAAVGSADQL